MIYFLHVLIMFFPPLFFFPLAFSQCKCHLHLFVAFIARTATQSSFISCWKPAWVERCGRFSEIRGVSVKQQRNSLLDVFWKLLSISTVEESFIGRKNLETCGR